MADKYRNEIRPHEGFQENFVRSNVDVVFGGGQLGAGKSFAAIMSVAEPSRDPKFRAVFLRNNLGDLRASGGIIDDFRSCYGMGVKVVESGEPHADFPQGSRADITHVADQSKKVLEKRFKGRQYDLIYYDELTGFTWECFSFMFSRNRGKAFWTGKVRATTNPKRSHWVRKFIDWYIGVDGEIIEERAGVVRFFFNAGNTVEEVVWGDSKEEVYNKCKIQIDRFLKKFNGKRGHATYKDVIKSFTFYLGRTSENEELGPQYASSVAAMGGKNAEENSGNWNVDTEDDEDAVINPVKANDVFMNDPMRNGDRWITCDLADTGTDNLVLWAWDGFHAFDCKIVCHTTCKQNAEIIKEFAAQYDVADSHIIYDAVRATYINDYIEDAVQYVSFRHPSVVFGRKAQRLKDEVYLRLAYAINNGNISISEEIARRRYEHQKLKKSERITIQNEFLEECSVVRFMSMPSGKNRLYSKKEMNQKLGKGRSMDILDAIAMRFYPVLEYPFGEELERTTVNDYYYDDDLEEDDSDSIYSETLFS